MIRILFIGGASASGKSTVARAFAREAGLPLFELDRFRAALAASGLEGDALTEATNAASRCLVEQLISSGTAWVVEGGWIRPETAADLAKSGAFHATYCGYPGANCAKRLAALKEGNDHWLCFQAQEHALNFLEKQESGSAWYRDECERLGMAFFDFGDFEAGSAALCEHLFQFVDARAEAGDTPAT